MKKAKRGLHRQRQVTEVKSKVAQARQVDPERERRFWDTMERVQRSLQHAASDHSSRGRRPIRPWGSFEAMIMLVIGGSRLPIIVSLAHGPLCVSEIQRALGASKPSHVTEELQRLQEYGVVTWEGNKSRHVYRLTGRIPVYVEDGMVQICLQMDAGHWARFHIDEGGPAGRVVKPPCCFIDGSKLAQRTPQRRATSHE